MRRVVIVACLALAALGAGCVGPRQCVGTDQPECEFTDHVLTLQQQGWFCPTWNVQTSQYSPVGQPGSYYGVEKGNAEVLRVLVNASHHNQEVHAWYRSAGNLYMCDSTYPFVIYRAEVVERNSTCIVC